MAESRLQHQITVNCVAALLCALGAVVLYMDVRAHGQLHTANALAGVGLLVLAVGIALPSKLRTMVDHAVPLLKVWKGSNDAS